MSTTGFKHLGRDCPICKGNYHRHDCRESLSTGFVFCRDTTANPGGQWRYIKDDANGCPVWAWGEGESADRPLKVTFTPATPAAPAVPIEARDKGYRAIASCGLSKVHRADIAKRPYVTQAEIDALVAAGHLFTWQGGEPTKPAAKGLPGVVDGRLHPNLYSWAITIPNHLGQVAGVQLRNPKGGYFWASSASKGGAAPNLDSGELPLGVYGTTPPDGVVNAGEGYFKPALSAARHGGAWVGMAGGQWAKAPQQLRAALDALGCKVVVLNADGGAIANPNVMRSYGELAALLDSWGIPLSVRWWGQATKADGDCDEIHPLKFKAAKFISWAEFEAMAPTAKAKRQRAKDTKDLRRKQTIERAKAILTRALPQAHRETSGGYLPELPPLAPGFSGYATDAGLGAGKTTTIGRDIVAPTRAAGGFTLELEPRNSLGKQTADDHGLPHIHHFGTKAEDSQALGAMARDQGGMVLCPNSLPRAVQQAPSDRTMVIDEVMATLTEACEGSTLKGRYSETLGLLFDTMRQATALHIAESGLDQPTLDMVQRVSGKRLMMIRHHGSVAPWQVHLATGGSPNGMFAQMAVGLKQGQRYWLTATSLDELTAWEIWATENGINSVLITGETNESGVFDDFFAKPDDYLENNNVQFLLTNQSVQTGLSVKSYHFDAVYAYAPGFPVEVVYQMMGRYRLPCPRYAWVPEFIPPSRWERPRKESALAEINHEVGQWAARGFALAAADPDQAAIDDYLAARWEKAWAQKVIPGQALTMMLERSGHTVTPWELAPDEGMKELRATYRDKLARNRAEFHAGLAIDPEIHTPEWAKAKRDDGEATYQDRCILRKLSTLEKFPGIDWDSPEIWYQAWFMPRQYDGGEQTHGPIGPGASLWAECGAADLLQGKAGDDAAAILAQRLRSIKLLPDYGAKLAILAPMRPLCEQILAQGTTAPGCPLVRRLAAMARAVGDDLYRYLRIVAGDDHSDQAIAHKILRKFGLTVARSTYRKVGRARQWAYTVTAPPLWQPLVEARQKALEALQAKASTGVTDLLEGQFNKSVTAPPGDIDPDTWRELREWSAAAVQDGLAAMTALKDMVTTGFGPDTWAALEVATA